MPRLLSVPTSTAWLLMVIGVGSFLSGWLLGWVELFVIAAACATAIVLAVPFILGHTTLELRRTVTPERVTVDEPAVAEMRAVNLGAKRTASVVVEERVAGTVTPIEIPELSGGQAAEFLYNLPTTTRGKFEIGPATISRGDPLGLMRRSVGETGVSELWVHPRRVPTKALASGMAKDLEGPTFDTSPAGDVAFHTVREYQPGDDVRHVHWMSTARKGTLMVRHYVDNRRSFVTVVVDEALGHNDPHLFERAIEIVASLGASTLARETPMSIRVGQQVLLGQSVPKSGEGLLDDLSMVTPSSTGRAGDASSRALSQALSSALADETATSVLAIVTGRRTSDELLALLEPFRRRSQLLVINLHQGDRAVALPRVRVINAQSLDEFAVAWDRLA